MLTELLLEGAGITQQQILVIRACGGTNSFEGVASILVEHDSRTLSAQSNPANQPYRPLNWQGKGRTGYSAAIAEDEEEWLLLRGDHGLLGSSLRGT